MTAKLTQEEYIDRCRLFHNNRYEYDHVKYVNGYSKVLVTCKSHGDFSVIAINHMRKSGCPLCANTCRNRNNKKTHEQLLSDIELRNEKFKPIFLCDGQTYSTAKVKYEWKCTEGHTWKALVGDVILSGHGCPICAVKQREETNIKRYGVKYITQVALSGDSLQNLDDKNWLTHQHHDLKKSAERIAQELGTTTKTVLHRFHKLSIEHKRFTRSQSERQFESMLQQLVPQIEYVTNCRSQITGELDFYFPQHNLAVELNGVHWHSEQSGRTKDYHISKTKLCSSAGIQLLQFWEYEWITKQKIIISMLQHRLKLQTEKIFARKCTLCHVSNEETKLFLTDNHLQGYASSSLNIGLRHGSELVSVMTFASSRFNKQYQYELIRLCSKQFTTVVGGASRMFNYFTSTYSPNTIISYSDKRYASGNVYKKLGFVYSHTSSPNYFYFRESNDKQLFSRQKFQKHKLKKLLEVFDPDLTEWQNMQLNSYDRVWDCGNDVWVWNRPN